jgi:uncharacterized protein YxeA
MKKSIILVLLAVIITIAGLYKIDNQVITYDSNHLTHFSDCVKYDRNTKTIYTKGKVARWAVQRAEKAFLRSGDKEFWMDNGLPETSKNYKCVEVKHIVYGK